MSFQISPRYNEEHEHVGGDTCILTFRRTINNTEYLFTRVGSKDRTIISVTKFDVTGGKAWQVR